MAETKFIPAPAKKSVECLKMSPKKVNFVVGVTCVLSLLTVILLLAALCVHADLFSGVVYLLLVPIFPFLFAGFASTFFFRKHHARQVLCAITLSRLNKRDFFSSVYFIILNIVFSMTPKTNLRREDVAMYCYTIQEYWKVFADNEKRGLRDFQYQHISRFWNKAAEKTVKQSARVLSGEGQHYFS